MPATDDSYLKEACAATHRHGFCFVPTWCPDLGTYELGSRLGSVVDVASLLPKMSVPTVQTLVPHRADVARPNVYSQRFGLASFPIHTDLAHWARPPRYFLLRCKSMGSDVKTNLLAADHVLALASRQVAERAVFRARSSAMLCPLPFLLRDKEIRGARWDPIFILPLNIPAHELAERISSRNWNNDSMVSHVLSEPGDTLLVDNWRFLHGRGPVAETQTHRTLERVYLSGLHS
jgi:L-asparagine oxygenase